MCKTEIIEDKDLKKVYKPIEKSPSPKRARIKKSTTNQKPKPHKVIHIPLEPKKKPITAKPIKRTGHSTAKKPFKK